jgi:hypothetical protein
VISTILPFSLLGRGSDRYPQDSSRGGKFLYSYIQRICASRYRLYLLSMLSAFYLLDVRFTLPAIYLLDLFFVLSAIYLLNLFFMLSIYSSCYLGRLNGDRTFRTPSAPKVTIVNIPDEACSVKGVQDYFSQFGPIENIFVFWQYRRAIVEFQLMTSAQAAFESPEAPWNNRFVKIFWFRDRDDRDIPSATLKPISESSTPPSTGPIDPEDKARRLAVVEREKQRLAEQLKELQKRQDEERARLMAKLNQVSDKDKMEIMQSLGSVSRNIAQSLSETAPMDIDAGASKPVQKDQLDRELDLISKMKNAGNGTDTTELQKQLEVVKAEVCERRYKYMESVTFDDTLNMLVGFILISVACGFGSIWFIERCISRTWIL